MADRFVLSHLKRLSLFKHLPDEQLERLADAVQVLNFNQGMLVVRQRMATQGLFLFVSGRALLTQLTPNPTDPAGGMIEQPVGEINAGQYIGERALFEPGREPFSVRVVEPALVLFLSRQRFANLMANAPDLRTNITEPAPPPQSPAAPPPARPGQASAPSTGQAPPAAPRRTSQPVFAGQRDDERVVQVFRRHWWSYVRWLWLPLVLALVLLVFAGLALQVTWLLALVLAGLALIIPGGIAYLLYVEWQDDSLIVTDQRVVRILTTLLSFDNSLSETPLSAVLEVSTELPPGDIFARVFGYGTAEVKTPGDRANLKLTMVPQPSQVRDVVFAHRSRHQEQSEEAHQESLRTEVAAILGKDAAVESPQRPEEQATPYPLSRKRSLLAMKFTNKDGNTVYRKHYTDWLAHIMLPAMVIGGSIVVMLLNVVLPSFLGGLQLLGYLIPLGALVIGVIWFYLADWDWRNDLYIISDEAIVLVHKRPFWLQNVEDQVRLSQVDNVTASVNGLLDNILRRGRVEVSLVGSDVLKQLYPVLNPQEIQAEISRRQSAFSMKSRIEEEKKQRAALAELLQAYHNETNPPDTTRTSAEPPDPLYSQQPARPAQPQQQPPEPPPSQVQDGSRPPRVPRVRPNDPDRNSPF